VSEKINQQNLESKSSQFSGASANSNNKVEKEPFDNKTPILHEILIFNSK
jgi:hypothetical protein